MIGRKRSLIPIDDMAEQGAFYQQRKDTTSWAHQVQKRDSRSRATYRRISTNMANDFKNMTTTF